MSYLLLDDGFAEHGKVIDLSDRSFRFHVVALCFCARNLTDGHISARAVKVISAVVGCSAQPRTKELVTAKLWRHDESGDGFWIHDYLKHNPTKEKVVADREAAKERQRKWRESHRDHTGQFTEPNDERNALRDGSRNGTYGDAAPSHPLPSQERKLLLPAFPSYEGDDAHASGSKGTTLDRLVGLARTDEDRDKVRRAAAGLPEFALVNALEAANGRGVRDRLAAALARLKKLRTERSAA